ncbi:MAG TPA: glycosyl hydrolase family 18 protein [Streptosporangiaceae bacterium]|nr:glycosyl hydrolase family 18 protein [Streptosporangiaceae bacterium]
MRFAHRLPAPLRAVALTAAVAAIPLIALVATAPGSSAATKTVAWPAHYAAPYLQLTTGDWSDVNADMQATGLKFYTLAFLTPKSGCTPMWEDGNIAWNNSTLVSDVQGLQAKGGNVEISFGGASGGELAITCTSVSSLEAAYASVVKTYGVTRLDFDIEGSTLGNTSANLRRDQALAALQKADPSVQVDFTIAVNPNGLPSDEVNMLKQAVSANVNVNLVNIMTMDFGSGQPVLADAKSAAVATAKQMESIFGISSPDYAGMGLTPIAGKNDDREYFSISDAKNLESFAASHGVQELAFWEVDQYDKHTSPPWQYSAVFNKITG